MRNRCAIAGAAGKQLLTIPVKGGRDHHQLYRDTRISYTENWQRKHLHAITTAYASSPFFEFYFPYLKPFFENKYEFLFDFNLHLLEVLARKLNVEYKQELTVDFVRQPNGISDYRYRKGESSINFPRYYQIFEHKNGFIPDLSIIDLLFHIGPEAKLYILKLNSLC